MYPEHLYFLRWYVVDTIVWWSIARFWVQQFWLGFTSWWCCICKHFLLILVAHTIYFRSELWSSYSLLLRCYFVNTSIHLNLYFFSFIFYTSCGAFCSFIHILSCSLWNHELWYLQVLSDEKKRALYDQYGEAGVKSTVGGGSATYTVILCNLVLPKVYLL